MKTLLLAALAVALLPLNARAAEPALGGNCPVCLVEMEKLVPGSPEHAVTFDRQVYLFPSAKEQEMFSANPAKYAPALAGDCVVCKAHMGVRVPGKVEFATVYNGRAYLFPSAKERDAFLADAAKYEKVDLGLGGYCPVCALHAKKWMSGKKEIVSVYDGMRYYFPSDEEKQAFDANPAKFTPTLDGYCAVCLKDAEKRVPGSPQFSAKYANRLYLFPDEPAQQKFLANPGAYADADVANAGNCIVCAAMAKKEVPGKAEFASIYKGQRYFFPSAKERDAFDADPASFVAKDKQPGAGTESNVSEISTTGKTACAGCNFGVSPIADADSLGIAVVTDDKVYVVEGGEQRFPELFDARFEGLAVALRGTVKKIQGKFVWVEPTSLVEQQ